MEHRCAHLRLNGARCTMPALRGRDLCFTHQQRRAMARTKPVYPERTIQAPLVSFVYMDDHISIQHNINSIARAFAEHYIDHRQVTALTYLMQTSLKTLRQMRQLDAAIEADQMPTDIVYDQQNQPLAANERTLQDNYDAANPPPPRSPYEPDPALVAYFHPDPVPDHLLPRRPATPPTSTQTSTSIADSDSDQNQAPDALSNSDSIAAPDAIPAPAPAHTSAEPGSEPDQQPAPFQTLAENKPVTHLLSTLTEKPKITDLFSNTCEEENQIFPRKLVAKATRQLAEEERQWADSLRGLPLEEQLKAIYSRSTHSPHGHSGHIQPVST